MLRAVGEQPAHEGCAVDHLGRCVARSPGAPPHAHPARGYWLPVSLRFWVHDLCEADACTGLRRLNALCNAAVCSACGVVTE